MGGLMPNKNNKKRTKITVCTWNLLVPVYCNQEHYVNCTPKDVDTKTRFTKILEKIKDHLKQKNTIFVFQEVSREWGNQLKTWFKKHRYAFDKEHYGNKYSDYMGVAIAYPNHF